MTGWIINIIFILICMCIPIGLIGFFTKDEDAFNICFKITLFIFVIILLLDIFGYISMWI